jgi:NADH-quinone oxidoreductase subunit N
MVVLMVDLFNPDERDYWTPILALAGVSASFIMTLLTYSTEETIAFGGMFVADPYTNFLNIVVLVTVFIGVLLAWDYLRRTDTNHGEYYTLLLLSATGVMFMAGANDLLVVFIALELLSIPLYVLAAFRSTDNKPDDAVSLKSEESGMKYFILGAFASAFFVYGAALVYGATGTTNLPEIFAMVENIIAGEPTSATVLLLLGSALVLVGLGFKVAVVPFHMWTPDVYEGAPTPVTAYMSVAAKVGGFAALMRIMVVGLSAFVLEDGNPAVWQNTVWIIAAVTLILGNFVALSQKNVKRMLAYSSIAHAGYLLMAVAAAGSAGVGDVAVQSMLVYLMAYMFTNLGAFGVVLAIENKDGSGVDIDDFAGLFNSQPALALAMAIFMFSLTGVPLTAGFMGKWLVFGSVVQAGLIPLAVIGVLTSVISAFYYVRIIVNMFLNTEAQGAEGIGATRPVQYAVYASMAGVLIVGILPFFVTNLVQMVQL